MSGRASRRPTASLAPLLLALFAATTAPVATQQTPSTGDLAAFGERMVGSWEAGDSRHVFEWGVGERVVRSRSYAPEGDGWRLVSEGFWYWDPSAEMIRGRTVAVGMGIDLFEYTTRVEGDRIVHRMTAHGEISGDFVERWRLDADGYTWSLEQDGERIMGGRYDRIR